MFSKITRGSVFTIYLLRIQCFLKVIILTNTSFWKNVFESSGVLMKPVVCVPDELPYLRCPLHVVLKLTPVAYGKQILLYWEAESSAVQCSSSGLMIDHP